MIEREPENIIHITETELFRLEVAYTSISSAKVRGAFLRALEAEMLSQGRYAES